MTPNRQERVKLMFVLCILYTYDGERTGFHGPSESFNTCMTITTCSVQSHCNVQYIGLKLEFIACGTYLNTISTCISLRVQLLFVQCVYLNFICLN